MHPPLNTIKFPLGSDVYHKISNAQGVITGIVLRPGAIVYYVSWGHAQGESGCYDFELMAKRREDFSTADE